MTRKVIWARIRRFWHCLFRFHRPETWHEGTGEQKTVAVCCGTCYRVFFVDPWRHADIEEYVGRKFTL